MPAKIRLNQKYISNPTLGNYLKIIFKTVVKVVS
jgi:lipopolysaccharide/colanic/teichoic acid biosynthesis glycosyltransferase